MAKTISVTSGKAPNIFKELPHNKELIYFFTWREFKIRYKQTVLGFLWVTIQPLAYMIVISFILLRGFGLDFGHPGTALAVSVYSGLMMWSFFEQGVARVSNCLVENQDLIKKVYFPHVIPIISVTLSGLIDFIFTFFIFLILLLLFDSNIHMIGFLILPLSLVAASAILGGLGLLLATMNLKYRDIRHLIPFIMRIMFFTSLIFYPLSILPQQIHALIFLIPIAGIIYLVREGFFNPAAINWWYVAISGISTLVLLVVGYLYFKKFEYKFVDSL
jgi:lipopolysaccharide transport system permease protein